MFKVILINQIDETHYLKINQTCVYFQVTYALGDYTEKTHGHLIGIYANSGAIYLRQMVNYEEVQTLPLTITAADGGPGSTPVSVKVTIYVMDVNDNAPEITINVLTTSDSAQVRENADVGTFVAHVAVKDRDIGQNSKFECYIDDKVRFRLETLFRAEYKITTRQVFDREERESYSIVLTCADSGIPSLFSTRTIEVAIVDENDHSPSIAQSVYEVRLAENSVAPAIVMTINATDEDSGKNRALLYRLRPKDAGTPSGILAIDPINGHVCILVNNYVSGTYNYVLDIHRKN